MWSRQVRFWVATAGFAVAAAGCGGAGSSAALQGASAPNSAVQAPEQQAPPGAGAGQNQAQAPGAVNNGPAAAVPAPVQPGQGGVPVANGRTSLPPPPGIPKPGAVAPGASNANFASEVGVTANSITFGMISFISATRSIGPAVALPTLEMINAYFKEVNDQGGVAGRKVILLHCDDAGDISRARACYEKLKTQVYAFVPSETWLTDTIHDQLAKDRIPWLSWGWFESEWKDPYMFPCHANALHELMALADWVAQNKHPQTVGIEYLNVSEDINAKNQVTARLQKYGIKVVEAVAQEWDSPDESQHVLAMRVANPDMIMTMSWPTPVAKFLHDAEQQHYMPPMGYYGNHLVADPAYGALWGDRAADHLNGVTSYSIPGGLNQPGEDNLPGNKLMFHLTQKYTGYYAGGFHFKYVLGHHITQAALGCSTIVMDIARKIGPNLTRPALIQALEAGRFDTGFGQTLYWPHGSHDATPYSFAREYLYTWVKTASDGTWDLKRVSPDPNYSG
jgi:hypothetical protein